jgi:hypothetical protein
MGSKTRRDRGPGIRLLWDGPAAPEKRDWAVPIREPNRAAAAWALPDRTLNERVAHAADLIMEKCRRPCEYVMTNLSAVASGLLTGPHPFHGFCEEHRSGVRAFLGLLT